MILSTYQNNSEKLEQLMGQIGISSSIELSSQAGVSPWQLERLQRGLIGKMDVDTVSKIARALQLSIEELVNIFGNKDSMNPVKTKQDESNQDLELLKQEYQRLQQQLEQQQETLSQEFQSSTLYTLESLLLQWPTIVAAVEKNPQLPAIKLIPLVKPLEQLLQQWGINAIASVGEEVNFDPQQHQLLEGFAEVGDKVKVRYVGYQQKDKLLYRAKVSKQ